MSSAMKEAEDKHGSSCELGTTVEHPEKASQKKRNLYRMFKTMIFIGCLTGFGFQTTEFLTNFFKYPTVMNTNIKAREEFPTPALTFCSRYLFNFEAYCEVHPGNCEVRDGVDRFGRNTTAFIPKVLSVSDEDNLEELTKSIFSLVVIKDIGRGDYLGPFYFYNELSGDQVCYTTLNGYVPSGVRTTQQIYAKINEWKRLDIDFAKHVYSFDDEPTATLYIHSPFHHIRKSTKSVVLKWNREYEIVIRLEEERLLPPPYDTGCEDYEELWKKNNNSGPASREMCEYLCGNSKGLYYDMTQDSYLKYAVHCDIVKKYNLYNEIKDHCDCIENCKEECLKLHYDFSYTESKTQRLRSDPLYGTVIAEIALEKKSVRVLSYVPQYMDVEVFSYVGGFVGCWLGISLWTSTGLLWRGISFLAANVKRSRKLIRLPGKSSTEETATTEKENTIAV